MRRLVAVFGAVALFSSVPLLASETMNGKISDSMCGAKHDMGEHGGKKMTERECVEACVKDGEKYVFVVGDKIYKIDNQNFAGLKAHAGEAVVLTGDVKGDTVKVEKIEAAKKPDTKK